VEAVEVGVLAAEVGVALASVASSSCTSSYLSELLRMMILPSPGGAEDVAVKVAEELFGELLIP
jgi:hypothetical protein